MLFVDIPHATAAKFCIKIENIKRDREIVRIYEYIYTINKIYCKQTSKMMNLYIYMVYKNILFYCVFCVFF